LSPSRGRGQPTHYYAYVGCFTTAARQGTGDGITVFRMNGDTGAWRRIQHLGGLVNPSWLLTNESGDVLYSLHADGDHACSYRIDRASGRLTSLNKAKTGGRNGVSAKIDRTGRFLIVANYGSGGVGVLPIAADGSLGDAVQIAELPGGAREIHRINHQGNSHPHDIMFDPSGRFVVVPDKGLDRVFVFRFDPRRGRLSPAGKGFVDARSGAGPRHVAFHPTRPIAWVANELDSTVTTYHWNGTRGVLSPVDVVSTLPGDFTADNQAAEIAFMPSTSTLYVSNRGHESIALYRVNRTTGVPRAMGWQPSGGKYPRYFGLDSTGRFLYAANMESNAIKRFQMDARSGRLSPTRQTSRTASPVTMAFVAAE
jgi:6-phosphogluconolactonase